MNGYCYGYSEALLANIQVLDGTFDADKFRTGDYVLLTQILGATFFRRKNICITRAIR